MQAIMTRLSVLGSALLLLTGCDGFSFVLSLDEAAAQIDARVDKIQQDDPRDIDLPDDLVSQGDTVIINNNVTVVTVIEEQVTVAEVPDIVLLGIENLTGFDLFLRYTVNGELQGAYVYDGETLLLEYPCVDEIELISEDDLDPDTGVLVDEFDLSGIVYLNPDDFLCGDAFLITIDPESIIGGVEAIDLLQ